MSAFNSILLHCRRKHLDNRGNLFRFIIILINSLMKKIYLFALSAALLSGGSAFAQNAQQVLTKARLSALQKSGKVAGMVKASSDGAAVSRIGRCQRSAVGS